MATQFLRLRDVRARTGLARSTIYLWVSQKRFPSPVPLGSAHTVAWVADEVDEWIHDKIRAARGEPTAA
jgi:prophage regulatory protein